jgi:hypothetical protein
MTDTTSHNDGPPILGSWPRVYAAVLLHLAILIGLFWLFTEAFE